MDGSMTTLHPVLAILGLHQEHQGQARHQWAPHSGELERLAVVQGGVSPAVGPHVEETLVLVEGRVLLHIVVEQFLPPLGGFYL